MADTITAHILQTPPRPSEFLPWADSRLDRVISTALAKDPADRYATAEQLATAATPIQARPRPAAATRTLVIAAIIVIIAVVWLLLPPPAPDPMVPSPAITTPQAAPAREDLARLTRR